MKIVRDYGFIGLWLAGKKDEEIEKLRNVLSLALINICIWSVVISSFISIISTPNIITIEIARASVDQVEEIKTVPAVKVEEKKPLSIEEEIIKAFPECPETMIAIAKAESRLNPKAHNDNNNGSIDTGVFQINSIHGYDEKWLQDPINNIKAARAIYDKQGLTAWATYNYAVEHKRSI